MSRGNKQSGFTLIELMIASTVFTIILLLLSMGLIQIGRTFFKGVTGASTQEVTRSVIEDISQAIQFNRDPVIFPAVTPPAGDPRWFCIGNRRYSYLLNMQLTDGTPGAEQARHVFVVDKVNGCNSSTGAQPLPTINPSSNEVRELMGINMRLAKLDVRQVAGRVDLYDITIRIAYGDRDLLRDTDADGTRDTCDGGAGSQFCSVSELTTTVQKRL